MTNPTLPARPSLVSAGRARKIYLLAAMMAVVALAVSLIAANEAFRRSELPTAPLLSVPSGQATVGAPFELVDLSGQSVSDRSFTGRKRLMVFLSAAERDHVLATLQVINSARELASPAADSLVGIWIATDPSQSSPKQRAAILAEAGGNWSALTGPVSMIRALMRAFFVPSAHTGATTDARRKGAPPALVATVYLMDEQGSFLSHRTVPPDPAAVASWLMQSL